MCWTKLFYFLYFLCRIYFFCVLSTITPLPPPQSDPHCCHLYWSSCADSWIECFRSHLVRPSWAPSPRRTLCRCSAGSAAPPCQRSRGCGPPLGAMLPQLALDLLVCGGVLHCRRSCRYQWRHASVFHPHRWVIATTKNTNKSSSTMFFMFSNYFAPLLKTHYPIILRSFIKFAESLSVRQFIITCHKLLERKFKSTQFKN